MSELDGPVITDLAMYSDDREARKRRAEYVHAAVDGRNATSGEETTIPIPRSDDGIEELLDRLEADREEVGRTDIEDLEAEIDRAVYDLFDLTEDEREIHLCNASSPVRSKPASVCVRGGCEPIKPTAERRLTTVPKHGRRWQRHGTLIVSVTSTILL